MNKDANEVECQLKIKQFEKDYKYFMEIDTFPEYTIEFYVNRVEENDKHGFGPAAQAKYDFQNGRHTLLISKNMEVREYIMFHEFTHIMDSETYANKDCDRYVYLSGYTEYHASQVELMYLLGADKITDKITNKNVDSVIATFPNEKTVLSYLLSKHQLVVDMMSRKDFPVDIEEFITTIGVLYNYWGLRSICKMELTDYVDSVDNTVIVQILSTNLFSAMNNFMDGWFDKSKVEKSFELFANAIRPVIIEKNFNQTRKMRRNGF